MNKKLRTTEQITEIVNAAMESSETLDGDCKNCRVKRVCRVSEDEARQLGRNWNVDMVNGECRGECMSVLEVTVRDLGKAYEAIWQ